VGALLVFNTLEGSKGRVRIKVGVVPLPVAEEEEGRSDPDASLPSGPTMVAVMTLVSEGLPRKSALPPVGDSAGDEGDESPHKLAFAEVGTGPKPSPYCTIMVSSTTPGPHRVDSPVLLTDSVAR
jgi:hypothetical protein